MIHGKTKADVPGREEAVDRFDSRLTDKIERTSDARSFRFERPPGFSYAAGQYFYVTFAAGEKEMTKHFSLSSSPTEPFLELTTKLTGSDFKLALDSLPVGQEVTIEGPFGEFTLRENVKKYAFLSGGIGITPIRSIVKYATDTALDLELVLLYGNKTLESIAFREDLAAMDEQNLHFRLVHVLSEPPPGWQGHTGFVSEQIIRKEVGEDPSFVFYMCGPPGMVESLQRILMQQMKIPIERIVVENFTGY